MEASRIFGSVEDMELVIRDRCLGAILMVYDWRWGHLEFQIAVLYIPCAISRTYKLLFDLKLVCTLTNHHQLCLKLQFEANCDRTGDQVTR